jgi:hypothetical protein
VGNARVALVLRIVTPVLVLLLVLASFALPATWFTPRSNDPSWSGFEYFICGWLGPCNSPSLFGWYGNPFWFLALFTAIGRSPIFAWVGAALYAMGLLVALTSIGMVGAPLQPNEGGITTYHVESFGPGFYVWLSVFVVGIAGSIGRAIVTPPRTRPAS